MVTSTVTFITRKVFYSEKNIDMITYSNMELWNTNIMEKLKLHLIYIVNSIVQQKWHT